MAIKTVNWCTSELLPCIGLQSAGVIVCVDPASILVDGTVTDGVQCGFLSALICGMITNRSCPSIYTYTFSYDDDQLADPARLVLTTDIVGAFCKDCLTNWISCHFQPPLCVVDSTTIDFAITEDGCLTGDVKISVDAGNIISTHADGIYAADSDLTFQLTADSGGTTTGSPVTLTGGTDIVTSRAGDIITITFTGASGVVTSVTNIDGSLVIAPTTGAVIAALNVGHTNTWTILQNFDADINQHQSRFNFYSTVLGGSGNGATLAEDYFAADEAGLYEALGDQTIAAGNAVIGKYYYGDRHFIIDTVALSATSDYDIIVPDEVFGVAWNGSLEVPTKNSVYDAITGLVTGVSSVTANDTTLTIAPTTGAVLAQINLTNANIWTGKITSRLTTEQLRLGYDVANYAAFTVSSVGSLNITLTGTSPEFTLGNNLNVTGNIVPTGRVQKRTVAVADATSITPNSDTTDICTQPNTQAVGTLTINAPTGTPVSGQGLQIRIKSTNVQTFSFNAIYRASTDLPFPTASTGASKTDYLCFEYNFTDTKWDYVGKNFGF